MKYKCLAIIPARGGSKGIPKKNIRIVGGKPLIAHTIEHALKSCVVNRTIVSTDDKEIADVSKQYRAEIVWRPLGISGDKDSSESALIHVLDYLKEKENYEPDLVVFLQATSPLREPRHINEAVKKLIKQKADSCFSAYPEHFTGRWCIDKNGIAKSLNYEISKRPMRQEYPVEYVENGSIYVFKTWVIRKTGNRLGGRIVTYPMDLIDSLQIDTLEDLKLIEQLFIARDLDSKEEVDFSDVKLLVFDFDGVMTDNRVLVQEDGYESVLCDRGDGLGISKLKKAGLDIIVLSTEENPVVQSRCKKLGIDHVQNSHNKLSELKNIAKNKGLKANQIAYVGNDINDLNCMVWVGLPIAVRNAMPEVKNIAHFLTDKEGGKGAVREICDIILKQRMS
ncbi:MAG TPA: cytidylyltransferase domain-containing protein [Candidatus Wunengus sp. YC65]|uniref:cytidylyltransferase domain-containing protein n=1 Tax=Candidatus Wunengus sp. YC65 TaxID=3367701 RepID=UPI004027FD1C